MLNQLDCAQVSTPALSAPSSYAIGPIDPAQLVTLQVHLSNGQDLSLLIPVHLPSSLLTHPVFKNGSEWGYLQSDPEEEEWTVPRLMNGIYWNLADLCHKKEPDLCPWTLGFLLGELASVAERDRMLALSGLAHCSFLLSFVSLDPPSWPFGGLIQAGGWHGQALKAYRRQVRGYREQGKSFAEAQRLALAA